MRLSNPLLLGVASLAAFAVAQNGQDDIAPVTNTDDTIVDGNDDTVIDENVEQVEGILPSSTTSTTGSTASGSTTSTTASTTSTVTPGTTTTATTTGTTVIDINPPANTHGPDTTFIGADQFVPSGPVVLENIQGRDVFVMSATPAGDARLLADDVDLPPGAVPGDDLRISATIIVQLSPGSAQKRQIGGGRVPTDCRLMFEVNGEPPEYNEELLTTVQPETIVSLPFRADGPFDFEVIMTCGDGTRAVLSILDFVLALANPPTRTSTTHTATSTTFTRTRTTGTETRTTTTGPAPTHTTFPDRVNGFDFFGCFGSGENFPTFEAAFSSQRMDINVCTDACRGFGFAGIHHDTCYCGSSIDEDRTRRVPSRECNIPCPGNPSQFCGGNLFLRDDITRRQFLPNNIRLTVYIDVSIVPPPTTTTKPRPTDIICKDGHCKPCWGKWCHGGDHHGGWNHGGKPPHHGGKPPHHGGKPPHHGGKPDYGHHGGKPDYGHHGGKPDYGHHNPCKDGHCEIITILKPWRGEDCKDEIVYEKKPCGHCVQRHNWEPIKCEGERCHGKTVYKPEECTHDCDREVVVEEKPCHDCEGGKIYKPKMRINPTGHYPMPTGWVPKPDNHGGHVIVSGAGHVVAGLSTLFIVGGVAFIMG